MAEIGTSLIGILGLIASGDLGPYTIYVSKRGNPVVFPKAPPTSPPTNAQILMRMKFTYAASQWQLLSHTDRAAWEAATLKCSLRLTGYNLWTWWIVKEDRPAIATIERQSRITLL